MAMMYGKPKPKVGVVIGIGGPGKDDGRPPELDTPGEPDQDDNAEEESTTPAPKEPGQDQGQGDDAEATQAAHGYLDELMSDPDLRHPIGMLLEALCHKAKGGSDQQY